MLVPERAACICDTIYFLSLHLVSSGSSFGAVLFESYVFLLWLCVGLLPTSAPGFLWELTWGRAVLTNTCFFLSGRGSLWNLSVLRTKPVPNVAGALALEHIAESTFCRNPLEPVGNP